MWGWIVAAVAVFWAYSRRPRSIMRDRVDPSVRLVRTGPSVRERQVTWIGPSTTRPTIFASNTDAAPPHAPKPDVPGGGGGCKCQSC